MRSVLVTLLSAFALAECSQGHRGRNESHAFPSAHVANGTYLGVHDSVNNQDFFLGIPYAKPPTGSRRFAAPEPLSEKFHKPRQATEYGSICIGYGTDTAGINKPVSEDCLTLNVVRPAGVKPGDDLPVGIWVHGGSYKEGGSPDPRYNLSGIVEQSVKEKKPFIAVSINYRLSLWGFLFSKEMKDAGAGNIAFKDQRLALQWVQDNIAAFGGSREKVTIWGESAGARSLGMQLVAYEGNYRGLFRSAILESGSPVAAFSNHTDWQPYFNALVQKTGCGSDSDRLGCLRKLPWETLNNVFNATKSLNVTEPDIGAVIDGEFMTDQGSTLLKDGKFAHVPILLGNNVDEGTSYVTPGINTTKEFQMLLSTIHLDIEQITQITNLYPDDPAVGIPIYPAGRPPAYPYGLQYKRVAAFSGDYEQHSGRRLLAESYAEANLPVYSYLWNVYVNGIPAFGGATHFQEVAFVFNNIHGRGYAKNPFANEPESYIKLADLMSKMWVSFIHDGVPQVNGDDPKAPAWPKYTINEPNNLVFDANHTDLRYIAKDDYRSKEISYLLEHVF